MDEKLIEKTKNAMLELVGFRVGGEGYRIPESAAASLLDMVSKIPLDGTPEHALAAVTTIFKGLGVNDRKKLKDAQQDVYCFVNWLRYEAEADAWMADTIFKKTDTQLTAKDFMEFFSKVPGDVEVFFERTVGFGNIEGAYTIRKDVYGFFGHKVPCVIIGPSKDDDDKGENR